MPLSGQRILITRPAHQADDLVRRLTDAGAEAVVVPAIRIVPPASYGDLDRALQRLDTYDWVVFTSQNAVDAVFDRLTAAGRDASALGGTRVAAVGDATAAALERRGIAVALRPDDFTADGLLQAFGRHPVASVRVLVPQAAEGREGLVEGLRSRGAVVDVVEAYRTEPAYNEASRLQRVLEDGVDAVVFASPSAVRGTLELAGVDALEGVACVCIGPVTARAARAAGLEVAAVADPHTDEGIVAAILRLFTGEEG
ncbi:MAG: uroporphyrinogen-III synthase [Armatimonadota bacterium]|nr:uroporphyrinogen-III synthase [Armatimonadota bacterium]MDR5697718.1 uroporphyrinogen-III synthase [Armatimonadota bacterium]